MTRVSNAPASKRRKKKIISQAKGYYRTRRTLFRSAKEQLMRSWAYSYRDRKQRKRQFRKLWIGRINASLKSSNDFKKNENKTKLNYSRFIHLLKLSQIKLNRFQLSEMSIHNPEHFSSLIKKIYA